MTSAEGPIDVPVCSANENSTNSNYIGYENGQVRQEAEPSFSPTEESPESTSAGVSEGVDHADGPPAVGLSNEVSTSSVNVRQGVEVASEVLASQSRNIRNVTVSKKDRRVYFPPSTPVSGYMDPPNPWNDAAKCSTEELMTAYKLACDKHGVKPLPKLLHQLQVVSDFCDRNETLTLKGEKIDHKHCETLEEVLRRVQFRTIDLEATHLDEEGAVALFDMIEYYESAIKVNISYNKNLGPRGWQACARMLKKTPCLEYLDARSCSLTDQVMPMLGRSLRLGSQLTTLHLENSVLSGRPLMILVAAIKMNEILRELFLADNRLMPSDGIQLGNMLKYNHKLHLLDVRNNHLQDVGTTHLCDGLCEQTLGSGLNTLVLWNNQITFQSMQAMCRALSITTSLETLNLGHNNLTNEGIHRLKGGLLLNKSLLRIGLQASKICCEGGVALAEYIADSPRLLRIDLRENDIKTGGLMALSLSLKVSESVTRIDLDKEPKPEKGMKDYVEQQKMKLQDITEFMQRNRELARKREEQEEKDRLIQEELERENLAKQTEETIDQEESSEVGSAHKKGEQLKLALPLMPPSDTLESPAFVKESDLSILPPPTQEELATQAAEQAAALGQQNIPIEFPPSPMAPQPKARSLLASGQPSSSPTNKRKFFVSRVKEDTPRVTIPSSVDTLSSDKGDGAEKSPTPVPESPLAASVNQYVANVVQEAKDKQLSAIRAWHSAEASDSKGGKENIPQNSSGASVIPEESAIDHSQGTTSVDHSNIKDDSETENPSGQGDTQVENKKEAMGASGDNLEQSGQGDAHSVECGENADSPSGDSEASKPPSQIDSEQLRQNLSDLEITDLEPTEPDFHSSLSMNGVRVELASALDGLEASKQAADGATKLGTEDKKSKDIKPEVEEEKAES